MVALPHCSDGHSGPGAEIVFNMCNPGTAKGANELYETPIRVQRLYDERFDRPLHAALERLSARTSAPQSPILEMLQNVAMMTEFSPTAPRRRQVVVSDMLHHTAKLSQYTHRHDYPGFARSSYAASVRGDLNTGVAHLRAVREFSVAQIGTMTASAKSAEALRGLIKDEIATIAKLRRQLGEAVTTAGGASTAVAEGLRDAVATLRKEVAA